MRVSCQTIAWCTGSPVCRSHSTVVSRWLVMPTARMSSRVSPAFSSAPRTTACTRVQISAASCSTQPGCGKICACSCCSTATIRPSAPNRMHRLDVVPWSIAAM